MVTKLNGTDFLQTEKNSNGTLTPKGFFENVTNIGMGRTFTLQNGKFKIKDGAAKRNGWFVAFHVAVLIVGNVLSLIALAVREIIRAVDGSYKLPIVSNLTLGQGDGGEIDSSIDEEPAVQRLEDQVTEVQEDGAAAPAFYPIDPVGGGGGPGLPVANVHLDPPTTMDKEDLEEFIRDRLERFESPKQFQVRAIKLGVPGLRSPSIAYMEVRKMMERERAVSEIIPGLYLSGIPSEFSGLNRLVPKNFDEYAAYQLGDSAIEKRTWKSVCFESIFDGLDVERQFKDLEGHFCPMLEFDAILAAQGRQKDRLYPVDKYLKEGGESKYFAPTIDSLPGTVTNLSEKEFENPTQVKAALTFVMDKLSKNEKCLVFCNQGCDRSVSIIYGILRLSTDLKPREIMDFICIQRRIANDYRSADPSNRKMTGWFLKPIEMAVKEMRGEKLEESEDPEKDLELEKLLEALKD